MSRNNSIDPNTLLSLLQQFAKGGIKKYPDGGPYYTEDPSAGGIDLNQPFAQGVFDNQLQVTNPFGQPSNQIQLENQNFGNPQDTRPLIYDWNNNPEGYDSYLNSINDRDNLSEAEAQYIKENPVKPGVNAPDLQDPSRSSYPNLFDAQSTGTTMPGLEGTADDEYTFSDGKWRKNPTPNPNTSIDSKGRLIGGTITPEEEDAKKNDWESLMRSGLLTSPGSADMESTLFNLGRGIGADKGTKGKGAMIGLAATSALMKGARGILSGVGHQKVNDETQRWYEEQLRKRDYTPDPQAQDANYTGGYYGKDGGTVMNGLRAYLEGGTEPPTGGEPAEGTPIHTISDPRYQNWLDAQKNKKALAEYQKWHNDVREANPQTGSEFQSFHNASDSLAYAADHLNTLPESQQTEILWTNPQSGNSVPIKLDRTPVTTPYTASFVPTPYENREDATELRKYIRENHPDWARTYNLDEVGPANNRIMRSAYYEFNDEFEASKRPKTAPKPDAKKETVEPRVATKMQTVIHPDGRREFRQVPYYNYDTREDIPLPGGSSAVYVDENGQPVPQQKYGGVFENGGENEKAGSLLPYLGEFGSGRNQGTDNIGNFASGRSTDNYKVGQPIEFEYGGEMVSGKIKRIENGQIFI